MIAVGAILVEPIIVDNVPRTLVVIAVFVSIIIIMEYLQVKVNFFEKLFHGKAQVVIKDGQFGYELMPDAKPLSVGELKKT